jgi:hypothetical protein
MMPLINTFNPSVAVNTGTDIITINGHGFLDRQGVIYHTGGGTAIGALVDGYKYYIIVVSINTFKLALTEENAGDSIAVDLLSAGSGSLHSFETSNIYPNSAAYYDFFRKVRLLGNGTDPGGNTLEADSVRDKMTIVAGDNIVFENISEEQDTFTISGSEYDFEVPVGTTELRLYGRVGPVITDDQSIRFTVDRGINITRISDTELRFEGLGVTETDTLHSVTERGAITSNTIYLNNLEVGIIQSIPGEDGVTNFNSTGTTGVFINLTGDGTLDSPGEIDLPSTSEASKTVYINFTTPVSGTLTYSASYKAESALTTGSVILQRETPGSPGTWVTIDSASGTTSRFAYTIQNIYAEPNTGPTNFRIITAWTGLSTGYVDFPINLQFEISPIYVNEMIRTDTAAGELHLGRIDGEVYLRGDINIRDRINTDGLFIYQNVIQGTNSNGDVVIDPSGTGGVELRTQILNTDQTTFNLLDNTATTVNAFGSATAINIGANTGTITIENPTVVGTVAIQNLYDTNATTVNAFGDATTINIGDITGTITLRNPTLVGTETTQNVYDTVATTVNAFGAATTIDIGATTGTITINNPTLVGTQTTQNVYDTVATTVNAFRAATTIDIGAATGTTNVNNNLVVDLDLEIKGGDLTTNQTTFNLLNTTATTVNAFGAATTINFGSLVVTGDTIDTNDSSGITFVPIVTLNSDLTVENDIRVFQDLFVSRNASITGTLSVGGDIVGSSTLTVNSNAVFNADVQIRGGDLTTNQLTFNLLNNTATTVNAFGSGTTINIGSATGTTTVNNNLTVTGNLIVNGTTTTLNTATLDVEDLNITIAKGAPTASAANGAGLTVEGASATFTYASSDNSWNLNKLLKGTSASFTGDLQIDGNLTFGSDDTDSITANAFFVSGTQLKSGKANANTLSLAAYDVDGTAYTNLITLTASNTPTLALTSTGVGTINNMSIGATTPSTGKFTTLEIRDTTTTSFDLFVASNSSTTLTADRTLTIDVENASRTIALSGNIDIGGDLTTVGALTTGGALTTANTFTTAGNFALTLTTTAATNATLPSGTVTLYGTGTGSITSAQLRTSVTDETGTGALVFGTSPTITQPNLTYTGGFGGGSGDFTVDASLTQLYYWEGNFDGTRTLSITNLAVGRLVMVCVRNTNASPRQINVQASISTTGFAAVNMSKGDAGGTSVTSVTLAAVSGQAMITVFNPAGVSQNIVGMIG